MASTSHVAVHRSLLMAGAIGLIGVGALGAYLLGRSGRSPSAAPPAVASTGTNTAVAPRSGAGDVVVVTLTKEAAQRAGIELAPVTTSSQAMTLQIPGVVQPNAYKTIAVTPLTGGRLTKVVAELGQSVRRGQVLAEIYSPELVNARTQYLTARAALEAHELELKRTEALVVIGAASRQELEMIHAEHTAAITAVASDRARLSLFGLSSDEINALTSDSEGAATLRVVAPANGIVTARTGNVGLNVEPSMSLFTIADLSEVWVVGDLYERDFAAVVVGAAATVTFAAYPELRIPGTVTYIDPQVKAETHTAQVRVAVPNGKGQLRLGMLAQIRLGGAGRSDALAVPRAAIQTIGNRTVVYVADPSDPSRFVEREVAIGESVAGDAVRVVSGVTPGDVVVSNGSFSLRAERERLGLGGAQSGGAPSPPAGLQTAHVEVTDDGYRPTAVSFKPGVPARLTFLRVSERTCGTEVVIPSLNVRRDLPLNQPVHIEFTPTAGDIEFVCGMGMLKGTIVVK